MELVPLLVMMLTTPPRTWPYCASLWGVDLELLHDVDDGWNGVLVVVAVVIVDAIHEVDRGAVALAVDGWKLKAAARIDSRAAAAGVLPCTDWGGAPG